MPIFSSFGLRDGDVVADGDVVEAVAIGGPGDVGQLGHAGARLPLSA